MAVHRAAAVNERELLAEYPFLPGAELLLGDVASSVRDVVVDPVLARARELARARIRAAADDPTGATGVNELAHASAEERLVSFLYARLLLSVAPTPATLRRWAVAEAKHASHRLARASSEELIAVADRLQFHLRESDGEIAVALTDYLKLVAPIREGEFRLIRQPLSRGEVRVSRERAARLVQEGIRSRLAQPLSVGDDARAALLEHEGGFLAEVAARFPPPAARAGVGAGPLLPDRFPPCIRKMKRMLEGGENLSHSGRFALAAFLYRAGATPDTIVDAYRGAPDFDEGVTRYQVEHITQRDGGRGYEPPECETLRSHGLCFRDGDAAAPDPVDRSRDPRCFEPDLRHPLQYYRLRGGRTVDTRERH